MLVSFPFVMGTSESRMRSPSSLLLRHWTWIAATLFLLAFHWRGLECWFYQDDFGWLHLGLDSAHRDFLSLLFAPKAHGNIRPWSENLFFYGLSTLFGVNPVPFRIVVFSTVAADLFLLDALVRKLTGSPVAAVGAQVFWLVNPTLAPALCWSSTYNETQYLFFVLAALLLFIHGRYWAQAAVFVLALGSLETAVMYPCIASLYALLFDRTKLRRTLPLYLISAGFASLHFWAAPLAKAGPYAIRIDSRIFATFWTYIKLVLGPQLLGHFHWTLPAWLIVAGTAFLCVGVVVAGVADGRTALFGAGWFILLLLPVLPLPDHILEYLLTGPAMGLAMMLGAALASRWRTAGIAVGVVYLAFAAPAAWDFVSWHRAQSYMARDLVLGVVEYDRAHPGKKLLLTGMSQDQFLHAFEHIPFELYGMYNVVLSPGAASVIHDPLAPLFEVTPERSRFLVDSGQAAILDVSNGMRDVTARSVTPSSFRDERTAGSSITSTIAHIALGNGFRMQFLLVNTGSAAACYSLRFYDDSGSPVASNLVLAPGQSLSGAISHAESQTLDVSVAGRAAITGFAEVTAPAAVKVFAIFQQGRGRMPEHEARVPVSASGLQHFLLRFEDTRDFDTAFALTNPSSSRTANISIRFRYENGTSDTAVYSVGARRHVANRLDQFFPSTANKNGVAEFTSDAEIAVIALRFQSGNLLGAVLPASP
jgi:hypothetical protein